MRSAKTIFFYIIRIFLIKVKSGFAPKNQIVFNGLRSFVPEGPIIPLNAAYFSAEEKAIDDFFSTIHSSRVEEELYKSFLVGLTGEGQHVRNLTSAEIIQFANELPRLIIALYNYRRSLRKETGDGV